MTALTPKAEVCPRIPLCRLVPKPDSCTAANDRRAAVLHWMTLSAASRPLGPTGSHLSHLSRPGIAPAGGDFGAYDVAFSHSSTSTCALPPARLSQTTPARAAPMTMSTTVT